MQGTIIKGIGGFYYVHDGRNLLTECKARGSFRNAAVKPLVGDRVEFSLLDEAAGTGRIDALLPRKNTLIRPAVANIDQALIVVSATAPAFHPYLLDCFLLQMAVQELPVLIGIGKIDQGGEAAVSEIERIYRGAGFTVCSFSAVTGEGISALRELLHGKTTVFAGASGVGKSTLLNGLIPGTAMATGELSKKLARGRHTTRHSEMFFLEEDSFVLDTPGFTSLEAPDIAPEALADYYPEFAEPAGRCRFPDCAHIKEKDCGVKAALAEGKIALSRYEGYCQIREELRSRKKY